LDPQGSLFPAATFADNYPPAAHNRNSEAMKNSTPHISDSICHSPAIFWHEKHAEKSRFGLLFPGCEIVRLHKALKINNL
jgi:hypothetical protein